MKDKTKRGLEMFEMDETQWKIVIAAALGGTLGGALLGVFFAWML
jgi:hypothetical protein